MRTAWTLSNALPTEEKYESKAWVMAGIGAPARVNYSMQVLVAEAYLDDTRCFNLTDVNVFFLDNGMDSSGRCSPENGGCNLNYTWADGLNFTDRGVQYSPFLAGKPNLSPVSHTACKWHGCLMDHNTRQRAQSAFPIILALTFFRMFMHHARASVNIPQGIMLTAVLRPPSFVGSAIQLAAVLQCGGGGLHKAGVLLVCGS